MAHVLGSLLAGGAVQKRMCRNSAMVLFVFDPIPLSRRFFGTDHDPDDDMPTTTTTTTTKNTSKATAAPKGPIVGQLKNPIVAKLWAAREESKQRLRMDLDGRGDGSSTTEVSQAAARAMEQMRQQQPPSSRTSTNTSTSTSTSTSSNTTTPTNMPMSKTPRQSQTSISYPFSTDEFLDETYRNPWGQMRFGKILEDLDALAGNIAFHHVQGNPLIVTASVDRIRLRRRPEMHRDQHLSGKVTWVGTSSMEIRMQCNDEQGEEWLEAYFTFVTLDPMTKKATRVPALKPETPEERAHFELGALKAQARKKARKDRLRTAGQPLTDTSMRIDRMAADLLKEAGALISMPSLADPHSILMRQTRMQNAMVAQPQVRNLHDRIFGGFLMRRAFELAFANAYVFGGTRPLFLEVDDISFESPVDVGDLLVFNSKVLYTQPDGGHLGTYVEDHKDMPLVMMQVEAWVTIPEEADARVSNHFYFTFALPKGTPCRRVLPGNIDEARRMASRMVTDAEESIRQS